MPLILIKNNLKLMLRSKGILLMMCIMPVITIALLSTAFHDLLNSSFKLNGFKAGYNINEGSIYGDYMDEITAICKDNDIILNAYPDGDGEELLKSKTVDVFLEIDDKTCTIYKSESNLAEATILESIVTGFFTEINENITMMNYQMENGSYSNSGLEENAGNIATFQTIRLATDPIPDSKDYYGIIEIVYFMWCGMVSLASVISSEKKNHIDERIRISPIIKIKTYMGYLFPCVLATLVEVGIALLLSISLFHIHWGNIPGSFGILLLLSIAASSLGIVLFYICNNTAITIVVGWVLIFAMGFLGGSFQTYMYSTIPDSLAMLSPQYFINRTLVEFSTKGNSAYALPCVIWLGAIIAVSITIGLFLTDRKGRRRAE